MSDNRPPVYKDNGTVVFRASSVGMSLKALVALIMGFEPVPPSKRLEEIFETGHRLEPEIVQGVRDQYATENYFQVYEVEEDTGEQIEVELEVTDNAIIRGHVDGVAYKGGNNRYVVEAKSFSDSLYRQHINGKLFDSNPYYRDQLTVYMEALGLPALYAVGLKETDEDGNVTLAEVDVEEIPTPPGDINKIKAKLIKAMDLAEKGELPVECDCNFFCPTPYLHEQTDEHVIDDADLSLRIDALCATYTKARQEEKNAEAKKKEVGKKIEKLLAENEIEKGETDRFTVSQVSYNRTKLDKKALRKVVNLEEFEVEYPVSYPSISEKGIA